MIVTPKNWNEFQHYKDREPSWIKLHKSLLTNYEFVCLPIASKALAPMLWLLASEYKDGIIDASLDKIAFRLSMTRGDLAEALSPLIDAGFFDASEPLADCKQVAIPEKEKQVEEQVEEEIEFVAAVAATDPSKPEREFFGRGKEVLGKSAGGQLSKLLNVCGGNVSLARSKIELAATKQDAREFVAGVIRAGPQGQSFGRPLTEFQRKQAETNDVRAQLRTIANGGGRGREADRVLSLDPGERSENLRDGSSANLLTISGPSRRESG